MGYNNGSQRNCRWRITHGRKWLDEQIGSTPFIAAERFTIADITAEVAVDFAAQMVGLPLDPALKNLARWHQSVSSRPSAKA